MSGSALHEWTVYFVSVLASSLKSNWLVLEQEKKGRNNYRTHADNSL